MRIGHAALVVVVIALACSHELGCRDGSQSGAGGGSELVTLRIRATTEPIDVAAIQYDPASDVLSARVGAQGWLAIERRRSARPLTVRVPELCPVTIPPGKQSKALELQPVIDLGSDRPALGFDAAFTITVRHGCPERGRGRIRWRQLEGAPLAALSVSPDGFQLNARSARLEIAHPEPLPTAGIVPFSPRTQGRVVLEASWQGPGLPAVKRTLTIRATSRASGLTSVAVSQQLMLSGTGLHVQSAPAGGHAQVHQRGALAQLTPDAPGRWVLASDSGPELVLQAFWHDKTPYDCGRSECHAAIAEATLASPMSRALEAPLGASNPAAVSCMLECHVLGERGGGDGGFLDVASELGWTWLDSSRWQDLPQALRRLGGVRCTACHGPGAIPEPAARQQILRADVCATCHDAPPQYNQVQQWRASRMARSDATAHTREPGCATCHTTAGFLDAIGARSSHASLPAESANAGIACAACHAPHAPHTGARLIRLLPESDPQLQPRAAVCLRCHSPVAGELQPSASSGALWLGSVRVPARDHDAWELVNAASAHRAVPGGCVGCHGGSAAAAGGKLDHSFRSDPRSCAGCHDASEQPARAHDAQRSLQQRAQALASRLTAECPSPIDEPRHASGATASGTAPALRGGAACRSQPLTRVRFELALVLEDPAAAIHNGPFARSLLEDAEQQLSQSEN